MVVAKLTVRTGGHDYFIGASMDDILEDTKNFGGGSRYTSYEEISVEEARRLNVGFLDDGIEVVQEGTKSYMLRSPR